jgi:ribosomal protein S14
MQINLLNITEKKSSLPETTTIGFLNWKKAHKLRRGLAASKLRACIVSGRSRGVYRRYGVARTQIRFLLDFGLLFGTRKSSW